MMQSSVDEHLAYALSQARRIHQAISVSTNDPSAQLTAARSLMSFIDANGVMAIRNHEYDLVVIVDCLQRSAYHDPDAGGVQEIAAWCITQWLQILQHNSQSIGALQGLGQAWLSRAQGALARIHRAEGSSSSGSGNGRPGTAGSMTYTSSDEARESARTAIEADARLHTADYVEARGILLPATEYFSAAVNIAERQGRLEGQLLALTAESYMSLGNVSYSHLNEQYFRHALIYLRQASRIPGYTLSPYLQTYLDDYGRLID